MAKISVGCGGNYPPTFTYVECINGGKGLVENSCSSTLKTPMVKNLLANVKLTLFGGNIMVKFLVNSQTNIIWLIQPYTAWLN